MTTTPFRLSERNFRFYEPCIKAILEDYPEPVTFDPALSERSPATFSARLRDAMLALAATPAYNVNLAQRLAPIRCKLVVKTMSNGHIWVGLPDTPPEKVAVVSGSHAPVIITQEPLDCRGNGSLDLLCWLAHNHALSKPLLVGAGLDDVKELENKFDVAFEIAADGYILT